MDTKHPPRGLPESFLFSRKWPTLQKPTWLNLGFRHFLTPNTHSWESRRVIYTWWSFPPSKTGNLDTCPPRCSDLFIPKKTKTQRWFQIRRTAKAQKKERSSSMNVHVFLGVLLSHENSTWKMDGCKIINFLLGFFVLAGAMLLSGFQRMFLLRTSFCSFKNDAFGKDFLENNRNVGSRYGVFVPVTPLEVIFTMALRPW